MKIYCINEIDFDCIELIYFKTEKEALEILKIMNRNLDLKIIKFNDNLYSISLAYRYNVYFNK